MPDYDDRDRNDRLDDADDRPRRDDRDDDRPRKKKSALPTILIILGIIGVVCMGVCGVGGYFYFKAVMDVVKAPENFLAKVKAGDFQGAYSSTTSGFQSRYTLQQFTDAMKAAKLDQNTGISGPPATQQTGNTTLTLTTAVGVPSGTTSVTFKMIQEGGPATFLIDDITGPDISFTGPAKK
jgi:hypothetical protein